MPRRLKHVEFATPTLKDAETMWYLEGVSWLNQFKPQLKAQKIIAGISEDMMGICLDEAVLPSPEAYALRLDERLNAADAYLLGAYDTQSDEMIALLDVSVGSRDVPFNQIAALHGDVSRRDIPERKAAILDRMLGKLHRDVRNGKPIVATYAGWINETKIDVATKHVLESRGYREPKNAQRTVHGCLKVTQMVRRG